MRYMRACVCFFSFVALLIAMGCQDANDPALAMPSDQAPADDVLAAPALKPFRVTITGPTKILSPGQKVTIVGSVVDQKRKPVANEILGVNDGLTLWSSTTKTDAKGAIKYPATVNAKGAAVVEFIVRGTRFPFVFQVATKSKAKSLAISAFVVNNTSVKDLRVTTTTAEGRTYTHRVPKKKKVTILKTLANEAAKRVTTSGGVSGSIGAGAGGEVSVTLDNKGVVTTSFAGGAALLRFQVYGTTKDDLGACWAPGGNFGVTPVSLSGEVALCAGTDGISLGAAGEAGGVTSGVSVQIVEW